MDLQYFLYDLGDSYVSSVTSRVLPTSEMAILAKRCCRNRDSAVSSSGRLAAPFGGVWACLRAALKKPRLLFGLSEESAESRLGPLFRTPYFLSVFVHMPKRLGAIAFSGITEHMDWSVLYSWILKFRAPRSLQRRGQIVSPPTLSLATSN